MNKKLIAAAVSAAVVAPVAAYGEASFYGRVNNAIDINDLADGGDSTTDVSGVSSRFGFKYSGDIGNGLTAHGQYEFATVTDKELPGINDIRVATVGLSGAFGRVDIGNQWSSYFNTFGTLVSPTYTLGYYMYSSIGGAPYRSSNTIKYSNSFGPLSAELDVRLNDSDETSATAEKISGGGIGLGLSFAVNDNITIAVAFDSEDAENDSNTPASVILTSDVPGDDMTDYNVDADPVRGVEEYIGTPADVTAAQSAASSNNVIATTLDADGDSTAEGNFDVDADRIGIGIKANFGGYWISAGWQNYETDDLDVIVSGSVDLNNNGIGGDDAGTLGGLAVDANGDITTGKVTVASDIDTMFLYGGGNLGEKTNWLVGYSEADDGSGDGLVISGSNVLVGTDDSRQLTWGVYHNLGGGLRVYYEATDVDSENTGNDGARHLLGMRVDF